MTAPKVPDPLADSAPFGKMPAAHPRPATEAQLMAGLLDAVGALGGRAYHTYDARGSDKGYPDVTAAFPDGRVLFLEIKGPKGVVSPAQVAWLECLGGSRAWIVWPTEEHARSGRRRWPTVPHMPYEQTLEELADPLNYNPYASKETTP